MDISEITGQSHKTLENNHISKGTVLLLQFFAFLFTNCFMSLYYVCLCHCIMYVYVTVLGMFMSLYYVCFISGLFFTLNVNSLIC